MPTGDFCFRGRLIGRTSDFGSENPGSSPGPEAIFIHLFRTTKIRMRNRNRLDPIPTATPRQATCLCGWLGGGSGSAGTLPIRCGYLPSPATGLPGSPRSLNLVGIHTRTVQMQCCLDRLSVGPGLQHIAVSPHSRGAEAAVREGNGFLLGPPRDTLQ